MEQGQGDPGLEPPGQARRHIQPVLGQFGIQQGFTGPVRTPVHHNGIGLVDIKQKPVLAFFQVLRPQRPVVQKEEGGGKGIGNIEGATVIGRRHRLDSFFGVGGHRRKNGEEKNEKRVEIKKGLPDFQIYILIFIQNKHL